MSSQFQVDTARIGEASGDIHRISAEIESDVSAMLARLEALQGEWKGSASTRFQSVVAEWRATQRQVKESLDAIGRVLGQAGTQYEETEAAAERMFL
ncbi:MULTISPECIES: WXG100 family type VII secretion target [unclassified Janibacter]|uniref:WXG100 family type VII secretion target n=1 Tax=unclassified Janibacter TaxID=2649294 RepID=UPI003D0355E3